jgi:hypothetical protein
MALTDVSLRNYTNYEVALKQGLTSMDLSRKKFELQGPTHQDLQWQNKRMKYQGYCQ